MSQPASPPLTTLSGGDADGTGPDPDSRAGRARREPMAVLPVGGGRYDVVTGDHHVYTVSLPASTCTCPDHRHRGARCKHLRRVALAVTAGLVPPPGEQRADCAVCGAETFVAEDATGPHFCDRHRLAVGTTARDRETDDRVLVVAVSATAAADVRVPGTDHAVAAHPTNRAYPDDDPVVAAVYLPVSVTEGGAHPGSLRVYSFPASRLRPVDADGNGD
ncbi:MAG: SWIM zinc finger family protein [Halobacteriaceae archaeon]